MFMNRIKLRNILSFGPDAQELELKPLNVLIGPNGSGKSNLIEVIGLLQAAPRELVTPIVEGGGVADWIWQGEPKASSAEVEVATEGPNDQPLRYRLAFAGRHFRLVDERLEDDHSSPDQEQLRVYFESNGTEAALSYIDVEGVARLKEGAKIRRQVHGNDTNEEDESVEPKRVMSHRRSMNHQESILAQIRDPDHYPELSHIAQEFGRACLYREWSFGRNTPARLPQKPDLPNSYLMEDGRNLGLVLNRLTRNLADKQRLLDGLRNLYEGVSDFHVNIEFGTIQVFLQEGKVTVPATRLSDGTIRYLCLLTILCHPTPPPLVCIEEPELGLHPDILPGLAELLREASQRCQLIVTTHSDILVDALTDTPESVVVCEKENGQTTMKRFEKEELADWLERYSLGDYWMRGGLGGTRW